ncbi:ral GTPase-activating protein subunit alpha-2-like isoform X3 [Ursus arctos]|uniref:ral GTPase-activating protein subunit alpha-2-like isoform X1 n=1 Tax=Ursus arctos TaxID=9644 RepID=UPI002549B611|nr:ral GTPase-activating protein subunit alpha-2-like isoform X1 [Ursus arctos]XP_057168769.1 ral GTPase-activating protein subunit alpha-2-like isoform X3 [Ursus arctos]
MAAAYLDPNLNHTPNSSTTTHLGTGVECSPGAMERVLKVFHYFENSSEPAAWASMIRHGDATDVRAFLLPSCDIAVTRKVVPVYRKWILQDKPVFMEEPDKKEAALEDAEKLGFSETDSEETSSDGSRHKRSSSWGRTYSFTSAVSRGCVTQEENKNGKAGAQAMVQVFLTNAANVFLLEPCPEVPMLLREQADACKAVLIIRRRMIMELTMNKKT